MVSLFTVRVGGRLTVMVVVSVEEQPFKLYETTYEVLATGLSVILAVVSEPALFHVKSPFSCPGFGMAVRTTLSPKQIIEVGVFMVTTGVGVIVKLAVSKAVHPFLI